MDWRSMKFKTNGPCTFTLEEGVSACLKEGESGKVIIDASPEHIRSVQGGFLLRKGAGEVTITAPKGTVI